MTTAGPRKGSCLTRWMVMQDLEEAHWKQECPVCNPLVYLWDPGEVDPPALRRPRKFQILRNLRNLDIVVAFSSRRASPHYYGIITSYKSVLHGIHPHSTVPPITTTSASSSDLHPRTYPKFLGLLPYVNRRTHDLWTSHISPTTIGV